ncbi:MAG: cation transporter [Caulobacterales bacterium]|nr:cation transporter [Caulobacterales bacterium]
MVVEVVGGIISGSLALLADAAHMLTDAMALGLAVSAQFIALRPADERRHFGYHRARVLAAFVNGILLMFLLAWIAIEAIHRFTAPFDVNAKVMFSVAVAGLAANAIAFVILHGGDVKDLNVRGAMLHVVSDLLGSIAAIIAAIIILTTGWTQIDPILSMLVVFLIGHSAWRLLKETAHILLEGAPKDIDIHKLADEVKQSAPGVEDVHEIRIWQLTPDQSSLTMHARVSDSSLTDKALDDIKQFLERRYGITQSTVQIEVGDGCPDCCCSSDEHTVTDIDSARGDRFHHHQGHVHAHAHAHGGRGAAAFLAHD